MSDQLVYTLNNLTKKDSVRCIIMRKRDFSTNRQILLLAEHLHLNTWQ